MHSPFDITFVGLVGYLESRFFLLSLSLLLLSYTHLPLAPSISFESMDSRDIFRLQELKRQHDSYLRLTYHLPDSTLML